MDAAMSSAVSALQAQSTALSNISNNLANSQTTGYKAVETQFTSLLTEMTSGASFTTGGVAATARQNLLMGGTITGTSTATDMAINGNGMFAVTYGLSGGQTFYTQNGAFDTDQSGNLYLSGTNYYLEGWPTDTNGNVTSANPDNLGSLEPVNINKYNSSAVATTQYSIEANLPANAADEVGQVSFTNTSTSATQDFSVSYVPTGTSGTNTTYLMTVQAPTGETLEDNATTPLTGQSELKYYVTVDDTTGKVSAVTGADSGSTYGVPTAATTLPQFTAYSGSPAAAVSAATSLVSGDTSWTNLTTAIGSGYSQNSSMSVYDSLGDEQSFPITWTCEGGNNWLMTVSTPTDPSGDKTTGNLTDSAGKVVSSYSYEVSFNTDGTLKGVTALTDSAGNTAPMTTGSPPQPALSATWNNPAAAPSTGSAAVAVNLGTTGQTDGLSQFTTSSSTALTISVKSTTQNGVQYGQLTGVSVNSAGEIIAAYDNGQKVPIYKIPVVTFPNENGLTEQTDGVYSQSSLSGNYTLNEAGTNGSGTIEGQALEGSTVNTSVEFSNMITAQQAYSSASQVISTDKQMFQSLMQVVAG